MNNAIIIPCYNEANRLDFKAFGQFINTQLNYKLCFVNDGSTDETLHQLQNFAKQTNNVEVFDMPQNGGKAEAVRKGTQYMLDKYELSSIGFIDADLATGFEDYKSLVKTLKTNDLKMVFGSRKMDGDEEIERSAFRKLASTLIGMLIKIIVGLPIQDTQCGAKVFTAPTAKYVFNKSFLSRWLFDVEMFIRIKNLYQDLTMDFIKEQAVKNWEEVEGSHITLSDSLKFPKELLEIGFSYNVQPKLNFVLRPQKALVKSLNSRQAA